MPKTRHIAKAAAVRESQKKTLRHRERRDGSSCYDLSRDLAGKVKGMPRDLASNPKHMRGFGE